MTADDPSLLPEAPPPRPEGRDSAIGLAMRRFDGLADAPIPVVRPSGRRFGFGQRPGVGALVTASLIVVIGLPATLIAIRENAAPPAEVKVPAAVHQKAPAPMIAPLPEAEVAEVAESAIKLPPAAPSNLPAPDRRRLLSDEESTAVSSPPPPTAAYAQPAAPAPPPPPSAPTPQQETYAAERDAGDSQIVVTGGRVEGRSLSPRPFEALNADSSGAAAAKATRGVLADPAYRRFLSQLQAAVRSNDRPRVVALAGLPLRVNFDGGSKTYRDSRSMLADYDRIFTAKVRQAILAQRYESLFTRDQGLMVGNGEVWFDRVCRDRNCARGPVRILAINP